MLPSWKGDVSDSECIGEWNLRKNDRMNYPGASAFDFDVLSKIAIRYIIGWDDKADKPTEEGGVFGHLRAYTMSVEEQGRKTLHGHFLLWIKELDKLLDRITAATATEEVRSPLVAKLRQYIDTIMSTKLHGTPLKCAYAHDCKLEDAPKPEPVPHQELRHLRHKKGCYVGEGIVARCPKCDHPLNSEQLACNVINTSYDDIYLKPSDERKEMDVKHRLDILALRYVYDTSEELSQTKKEQRLFAINAFYNLHRSVHARACFKNCEECRYDLPQIQTERTVVDFIENPKPWFNWIGEQVRNTTFTIRHKRHIFDAFMNIHNPAATEAFGCNTNVAFGNIKRMFYATTYNSKGTQEEDAEAYKRVSRVVSRRIKDMQEKGVDSSNIGEGIGRLYGSIIADCQSHIISGPLAWYIMRNGSRFRFSHKFTFIPIHSFHNWVVGQPIEYSLQRHEHTYLKRSLVYNYIYRPIELNDVSLWDFASRYEVVRLTQKNRSELMRFHVSHPCADFYGVQEKTKPTIPDVPFCALPDLVNVGPLMSDPKDATESQKFIRERYAALVMILFVPYREPQDLKRNDSFLEKYRSIISNCSHTLRTDIVQNFQNCHNALRVERAKDPLFDCTVIYETEEDKERKHTGDNETDIDNDIDMSILDGMYSEDPTTGQYDVESEPMSFEWMKEQGDFVSSNDPYDVDISIPENANIFWDPVNNPNPPDGVPYKDRDIIAQTRLVELSLNKNLMSITAGEKVRVVECANGTPDSIQKWGVAYGLDMKQLASFEVLCATFVLTYYTEAYVNLDAPTIASGPRSLRHAFRSLVQQLRKLGAKEQLVMFMTGPGGSGKSRVINALLHYAKSFCTELGVQFTDRTIVVTAITGVAATSIKGETTHSAAHLNSATITNDHVKEWENSRLLLLDEISFANLGVLDDLDSNLRKLRNRPGTLYGGINILFSGDFHQLPPVNANPLYEKRSRFWHDAINSFVELDGQHRFQDDPLWGDILNRFRTGCPVDGDFTIINSRCHETLKKRDDYEKPPNGTAYACHSNRNRNAIHARIFQKHLFKTHYQDPSIPPPLHTIIIKGDLWWKSNGAPLSSRSARQVYQYCSDAYCKGYKQRCDPFLCLYPKCRLLLNENKDVPNGMANGTQCEVEAVVLKPGAVIEIEEIDGHYVRVVRASHVERLRCRFLDSQFEGCFYLKAGVKVYTVNMPFNDPTKRIKQALSINQFPVILNTATTGHKLQGLTKQSLFVNDWHYADNWIYVVLSRVTTVKGLFLETELDATKDYSVSPKLLAHEQWLRNTKTLRDTSDDT